MKFADDITDEYGGIDLSKGDYCQENKEFLAFVACPACDSKVFKEEA